MVKKGTRRMTMDEIDNEFSQLWAGKSFQYKALDWGERQMCSHWFRLGCKVAKQLKEREMEVSK